MSSLNYTAPAEATNLVAVELAADRSICIYAYAATDVIVDVFGVMAAPAGSLAERISFDKTVWPDFTPAGQDYAVVCNAGTTSLTMRLDLLPGASATLDGAPVSSGAVTRQVATDQLLTLAITRGAESRTYYFRCLPADFPTLDVDRPGNPSPGWYLTTFGVGRQRRGTVQRDLRQPRRAGLVQAHPGPDARLQAPVERHDGLRAPAGSGLRRATRYAVISTPRSAARCRPASARTARS